MKLIIDIDEDYYKAIWENGYIYDEDNEDIAKIIKDGTPLEEELENYWICVSDRLPNEDGYYDVINIRGEKCKYVFNTQGNSKEYWRRCALLWNPLSHKEGV